MRKVIVTGGSRGLGLGIVRRLICEGYCAIAVARHMNEQLAWTIAHAEQSRPGSLHFLPFDLGDVEAIPDLVKKLRKDFGPIYGLVNNAALGSDGALAMMHNAKIERLIRVNTLSPILLSKYVVRQMMAGGGGRVVNVASLVGLPATAASRCSARKRPRSDSSDRWRARSAATRHQNAVAPGFLDTEMTQGLTRAPRARGAAARCAVS
jgi:3-oxoacyl-[acyl-carrier protein] reductase